MNDMLIIEDVSYRYKVREDATLKHVWFWKDALVVVNQHLLKR